MTMDEADVPSPCCGVCRMNDRTGLCEGCLRTIDEIMAWSRASSDDKRRIWRLLPARRAVVGAMKDQTRP